MIEQNNLQITALREELEAYKVFLNDVFTLAKKSDPKLASEIYDMFAKLGTAIQAIPNQTAENNSENY